MLLRIALRQHRMMTKPTAVQQMDMDISRDVYGSDEEICDGSIALVELVVTCTGRCHGIVLWTNLGLTAPIAQEVSQQETAPVVESGAPSATRPDQRQGLRLLDKPKEVAAGDTVMLVVRRFSAGARLEVNLA